MKNKKAIFLVLSLSVVFISCSKKNNPEADPKQSFLMSDSMARMITIDTVKDLRVQSELKLTGKITFNAEKVIKIFPLVSGIVRDVKVELGDYVQKGQTLAVISSSEVAGIENEKISAEAAVQIAKKNLDATEEMYHAGVSSEKDFITAQKEYDKAQAEQKRVAEIFRIYNVNSEGEYLINAPISGFVVEKKVNNEMEIRADNSDNIFTVSGLDEVWVSANVYESDIDKVKEGYEAEITTLTYSGKIFKGKVEKVFNVLDPETKVMKIRIKLPNPGYALKPEMFANVIIRYEEDEHLPSVPAEAVVFDNSKNYVIVYRDKKDIETRLVKLYKTVNGISYVSDGVLPGDRIISRYHLLIYDAMND